MVVRRLSETGTWQVRGVVVMWPGYPRLRPAEWRLEVVARVWMERVEVAELSSAELPLKARGVVGREQRQVVMRHWKVAVEEVTGPRKVMVEEGRDPWWAVVVEVTGPWQVLVEEVTGPWQVVGEVTGPWQVVGEVTSPWQVSQLEMEVMVVMGWRRRMGAREVKDPWRGFGMGMGVKVVKDWRRGLVARGLRDPWRVFGMEMELMVVMDWPREVGDPWKASELETAVEEMASLWRVSETVVSPAKKGMPVSKHVSVQ